MARVSFMVLSSETTPNVLGVAAFSLTWLLSGLLPVSWVHNFVSLPQTDPPPGEKYKTKRAYLLSRLSPVYWNYNHIHCASLCTGMGNC